MTRFTADQLHTFVTVVEYGTFEAAADILMVSPSAISQRVKAMEQAAGRVLLRRTNPVVPTETGEIVLRVARQNEYLAAELESELGGEGADQSISIAINADSLATWFLDVVRDLAIDERIFCHLRREGEFHTSALLRSGEVMAALTSSPESIPGCSVEKLGDVRYWALASREFIDRYFPKFPASISVEELAFAPVVEYDRKDVVQVRAREVVEKYYGHESSGVSPTIFIPSSPDYARAVLDGIGWGIVPEAQCQQAIEEGKAVKLLPEPLEFPLYWQRWNINSTVMEKVTGCVKEAVTGGFVY